MQLRVSSNQHDVTSSSSLRGHTETAALNLGPGREVLTMESVAVLTPAYL